MNRIKRWACLCCLMAVLQPVFAEQAFTIKAQPLSSALQEFARQANLEILFPADAVKNLQAPALSGTYSPEQALEALLKDTPMSFVFNDAGTVAIVPVEQGAFVGKTGDMLSVTATGGVAGQGQIDKRPRIIEEVIVTATRREQSIQDVSMSISALGNEEIEHRGLVGMGDYLRAIPGAMSFRDETAGRTAIVMRGIAANPSQDGSHGPTVGVYFDETPLAGFAYSGNNSDIKLVDIDRVEVLRGPQGTLYGSSNLGGSVRTIPMSPDLEEFGGRVKAGYSYTGDLGGSNTEFQGIINIPLIEDKIAVRAVAYRYDNSGFYKNVGARDASVATAVATYGAVAPGADDIGSDEYIGGRLSVLWRPTDELSIKISYLRQEITQDGWPQADIEVGEFLQRRMQIRHRDGSLGDEEFGDDIDIANLKAEYDFGWATLLSSSSWVDENFKMYRDFGALLGFIPIGAYAESGTEAFVQEIRLVSQLEGRFQFVSGIYYEDVEKTIPSQGAIFAGDAVLNPFGSQVVLGENSVHDDTVQKAIFGETSFALTEQVKLTAGARLFSYKKENTQVIFPAVFDPVGGSRLIKSDEHDTNFKFGIDYTPHNNTLLYASWSQGFRLGRPLPTNENPVCDQDNDGFFDGSDGVTTGPRQIDSDYVDSYELGAKLTLLDNHLQINASIYQVDWEGIPVTKIFDFCASTLNAGEARSRGFEVESTYYPADNLSINFGASYVDAELTEDADFIGSAGDPLPGSPDFSFSLGVQYDFSLAGRNAFVRSDYAYWGGFYNNVQEIGPEIGHYGKLNLKTGVMFDDINVEVFINNLTDEDDVTWIDSEGFANLRSHYLRPRTIGVNVNYNF